MWIANVAPLAGSVVTQLPSTHPPPAPHDTPQPPQLSGSVCVATQTPLHAMSGVAHVMGGGDPVSLPESSPTPPSGGVDAIVVPPHAARRGKEATEMKRARFRMVG